MKSLIVSICILGMVGMVMGIAVLAGDVVTCTVTPGVYSVSVTPTSHDYGDMSLAATETSAQITANNDSGITEKLEIHGATATKVGDGLTWTLSTTATGEDIYVHAFSTKATAPATGATLGADPTTQWVALDTTNLDLVASLVNGGNQTFYLDMRTPATAGAQTEVGSEYTTNVTVVAAALD